MLIQACDLCYEVNDEPLLRGLNFSLDTGVMLYISGENGSGKTTLLQLLAGLKTPSQGTVVHCQQDIYSLLSIYQQQLNYLGHKPAINNHLSVIENCLSDISYHVDETKLGKIVDEVGLSHVAELPCGLLSAGQRRRVQLMKLQLKPAKIWLLDEPFNALDKGFSAILSDWIRRHLASEGSVVLTSHQALPFANNEFQEICLS